MRSLCKLNCLLFLIICCTHGYAEEFDPTKAKGDLQKIKDPLSKLFKLVSNNGRLSAEFEKNRQAAYTHVQSINSIGGNRGGGSSSSGTNWEIRINNNSFEGYANYGYSRVYPNPAPGTWKIKLKELKSPGRDLTISADDKDNIMLTLNGGDDAYLLRIRQQASGSIFVQEVSETTIFSKTSASFDEFCQENSEFTQNRFLPVIRHLGINAPMTQFDKQVQQSVLNFLQPIGDEELASFQTSFKNLDSTDYSARKKDSDKLVKSYKQWQDFIMRAVNDSSFPFETRFRMMEVMEQSAKPDQIKANRFAIAADLANDPNYLVWLYDLSDDANAKKNILAGLRKSTALDLGNEIAVWKEKFSTPKTDPIVSSKGDAVDLIAEQGALTSTSNYIGQLAQLHVKGKKLSLNRDHWSAQFGGKSIQQIVKQTNESLAKLNMPSNYDPDPLFELSSVSHPQAIFAKMRSEMQTKTKSSSVYSHSYNRTSSSSLNREFSNGELSASIKFEPTTSTVTRRVNSKKTDVKPPVLDGKPFKLDVAELKSPGRSFVIHQHANGRLRVSLITEKSNSVVQILQKQSGEFIVQDVRGAEIFTAKSGTFSEFYEKNKTYCTKKLFPLFAHFGVSFNPELFIPKPVEKAKSKEPASKKTDSKEATTRKTSTLKRTTTIAPVKRALARPIRAKAIELKVLPKIK